MADSIGKYELREILGKGAMGIVYEGFDPMIGRRLAIKTVRIPDQDDLDAQDELARFKREAQAAGRLSHPNIVSVFDYGETPALAYIVMEYVDGATLKQALDRNERFPLPEIVRMMRGLLAGLHYSHERGIVHRDIKPANVMRTQSGEIKIADFGIARIESSSLTQAGTMMGTPSYMSPEQFMGQTVDFRTDIYSAGVVLYQLLTGEKPFDGGLTAIMHKVLHTEPPPPSALSVTVPLAFDAVVQKAMAKLPSSRFASAAEFATSLQDAFQPKPEIPTGRQANAFADDEPTLLAATPPLASGANPLYLPIAAPPASMPEKKAFPKLAVASGAGALLMVAAAAIYLTGHQQPAPATPAPVPPAPVAAAPAVTPQPAPLPVMAAQRDAILQSRFGALPCTLIGAVDAGGKLRLTGLAGAGAPQAAFTAAFASLPAGITPQSTVQPFEGPYCAALDAIRPYNVFLSQPGAELGLGLNGGISILHDGQLMTVKEKMPSYAGYLQTDYFSGDGTVRHLYPTASDPLTKLPAESRKVLGNPKKGGASWKVSAPFGAKMIISIVTTSPLFPNLRPPNETASDYLPALRQALQNAASNNSNLDVAAVQLITEPKQ